MMRHVQCLPWNAFRVEVEVVYISKLLAEFVHHGDVTFSLISLQSAENKRSDPDRNNREVRILKFIIQNESVEGGRISGSRKSRGLGAGLTSTDSVLEHRLPVPFSALELFLVEI